MVLCIRDLSHPAGVPVAPLFWVLPLLHPDGVPVVGARRATARERRGTMSGRFRAAGILVLAVLALLAASCARISEPVAVPGGIPAETLASRCTVPAAWGDLVAVSSVA